MHCKHITCHAGCSDCCTNLTVSPVEYHAILEELRAADVEDLYHDPAAACAYLKGGLCMIYRFRPIICRTHGLPVAFENEDEPGRPEMSVSFCPKNFTGIPPEELEFGPGNTLDLDAINTELAEINLRFLAAAAADDGAREPYRRIPLGQLKADLLAGRRIE